MARYILIDGYNIINCWADAKNIRHARQPKIQSLEDSRDELINMIAEYALYTGQQAFIVFDAQKQKNPKVTEEVILGVLVVYTKENQTADSYIEVKVKELSARRRNEIRVATSDWAEQQVVMGLGASRISARELKIEIEQTKQKIVKQKNSLDHKRVLLSERIDETIAKELEKWVQKGE